MSLPRVHDVLRAHGPAKDHIALDYEGRFVRRKRLTSAAGTEFILDLAETTSLDDGDAFALPGGQVIGVIAADEPLLRVTGAHLSRLAWHIGNRHTPCQIEADHLLIRDDHVLAEMLRGLGAGVKPAHGPFTPEGGAYGHGRTMGHDHGPHDHAHDPVQGHDQGQGHDH